jgi:2-polyprenyl-6-methoxyphenol hydroxylase-like FAD-dependent oxidoreductase
MRDVLIVGAGPVGLTLAIDLERREVACRIIDKALARLKYCRAIGVTPRTLEVFERLGVARKVIDAGLWITGMRSVVAGRGSEDMILPDLGLPYAQLGVPQYETERVLTEALLGRGVAIERGVELVGLTQDVECVTVELKDAAGATTRGRYAYVIGCDGAHSVVRKAIGATFEGEAYPWPFMLGDVQIDWDLPYGMALRAIRPHDDRPPDMFVAIPLPEGGRYRVSMLAPATLPTATGEHGIQAETPGPSLADLQHVADDLLPGRPRLSDLRWSSVFRISMRLADRYSQGRAFMAGDAAHIHPPTGGQGMNTGIQDAHNLAWKLALVLKGEAPASLLDSYEAERRPVGAEVVARTKAASESIGRDRPKEDQQLVDAQVLVSYRDGPIVRDDCGAEADGPKAGDRAPDVAGLARQGLGFPLRLHEVMAGTDHVLLARPQENIGALSALAADLAGQRGRLVRVMAVVEGAPTQHPSLTVVGDKGNGFAKAYGAAGAILVRPDGHIGWRGASWRHPGLGAYLDMLFSQGSARIT